MKRSGIVIFGFGLALVAVFAVILAGLGSHWGWWDFRTGFTIMKWGGFGSLAAAVVSLIGSILVRPGRSRQGFMLGLAGLVIGFVVVCVLLQWMWTAKHVPPIHDITTDTENPPAFVSILPLRTGAANPAEYGGPEIAAQQHKGYPNLGPLMLDVPPDQAFRRALEAARAMGWEIVASNPADGRIEATDTTFWFGFKDDVVVRITPAEHGSRIDVRSVSRVGRSDVGTNAKRIQKYLEKIKQLS
ncbi:MAG TPA: DUF1499 domain-containing protein [Nitrospiria bacterium]|jgi:uncharacterized protein (DUF1499 family)|nr:DUF1499 domain-containing protein [Nitrospiria bacterium]